MSLQYCTCLPKMSSTNTDEVPETYVSHPYWPYHSNGEDNEVSSTPSNHTPVSSDSADVSDASTEFTYDNAASSSDVPFSIISTDVMSNIMAPRPGQNLTTNKENQHDNTVEIDLTEEELAFTGKYVPQGTKKNTQTCINAFCVFVVRHFQILKAHLIDEFINRKTPKMRKLSLRTQIIDLTYFHVFVDARTKKSLPPNGDEWPRERLNRLNNILIKFVVHYRKSDGKEIKPTSLKNYISGFQRGFQTQWDYDIKVMSGPLFNHVKAGVMSVIDNKIRQMQSLGVVKRSHNILTTEDIQKLYDSKLLSIESPKGFITRLLFDIAFMTGFRPSEMENILMKDVQFTSQRGSNVCKIVGHVGGNDGDSKSCQGGYKFTNFQPKAVYIWDMCQLDGRVNCFKDIKQYYEAVSSWRKPDDKFICQVNYFGSGRDFTHFFKKGNLGHGSYVNYMIGACKDLGITGLGDRDHMTRHGLRATVITQLFENGHDAVSVAMRSGHRQVDSAKAYLNIRGNLGKRQQLDLLPDVSPKKEKVDPTSANIGNDGTVKLIGETIHSTPAQAKNHSGGHGSFEKIDTDFAQSIVKNLSSQNQPNGQIVINFNFNYNKTNPI